MIVGRRRKAGPRPFKDEGQEPCLDLHLKLLVAPWLYNLSYVPDRTRSKGASINDVCRRTGRDPSRAYRPPMMLVNGGAIGMT